MVQSYRRDKREEPLQTGWKVGGTFTNMREEAMPSNEVVINRRKRSSCFFYYFAQGWGRWGLGFT